jgi:hypothetical protein
MGEVWIRREEEVEAIQLQEDLSNFDEVEKWLRQRGAGVYPDVRKQFISVVTDNDSFFVNPGDWAVQVDPYNPTMYTDAAFKERFYKKES